ncbi:MAG: TlpA family protein disulfide reductase [Lewinellaceae bacterium]|nr:TlpA family protein disulfide reductase [Lewinellaceae bacterium]
MAACGQVCCDAFENLKQPALPDPEKYKVCANPVCRAVTSAFTFALQNTTAMPGRMLLPFFLFALFFWQPACTQTITPPTVLSGKITLREGWHPMLYLVKPNYYTQLIASYEGTVVDSAALVADGSFRFQNLNWLQEKGLYLLFIQPEGSRYRNEIASPLPAENYVCLVLAPGTTTRVEGNARELTRSYQLTEAHPESRQLLQLRDARLPLYQEFEHQNPPSDSTMEWSDHGNSEGQEKTNAALFAFLDTAQAPLPVFAALRLCAPINDFRDQPEFYLAVLDRLSSQAAGHPWVEQLATYLNPSRLPVLKGALMPDFALPTPAGDTLSLKDLRSRLLLVDFWASWCAPCRREMKETIRPLYDQYHDKGFNVLGISIDRSQEAWEAALRKDGAVWPNVSDLLGDLSPVRQSLKFEYIPSNYLLDAEGRLLARNVHGAALQEFVSKYMQEH